MRHSRSFIATSVTILVALGGNAVRAGDIKPVTVSVSQSGNTITLSKAQPLIVRLPAQLGTGYSWTVMNAGQAPLRLAGSHIEHNVPGIPGGTETQVFRFEPTGTGSGEINFGYRQPWATDHSPQRNFKVNVVVDSQASP